MNAVVHSVLELAHFQVLPDLYQPGRAQRGHDLHLIGDWHAVAVTRMLSMAIDDSGQVLSDHRSF